MLHEQVYETNGFKIQCFKVEPSNLREKKCVIHAGQRCARRSSESRDWFRVPTCVLPRDGL